MLKRIALGTLVILCALALVTPASAVTVNGVEYVILAKSKVLMENSADCEPLPANTLGCLIINGNVAVSDPNGFLHIGSNNIINGTATAHHIFFGTNSHITDVSIQHVIRCDPGHRMRQHCHSDSGRGSAHRRGVASWPAGRRAGRQLRQCCSQRHRHSRR